MADQDDPIPVLVEDSSSEDEDDHENNYNNKPQQEADETSCPHDNNNDNNRVSHLTRSDLSPLWRYGMVVYLLGTLALLLASDIGSGIQAITITVPAKDDVWSQATATIVADESIFSSVRQLWDTGSYALAIFITVTSIIWPYVKMLLTLYSWVVPFCNGKRRERLINILDLLGKWSFADVLVFSQILVAFRATIPVGAGTTLEVYIRALWGFYGFVAATMLGLIGTHIILYHHRRYIYHVRPRMNGNQEHDITNEVDNNDHTSIIHNNAQTTEQQSTQVQHNNIHWTGLSQKQRLGFTAGLCAGLTAYIVGCSLPVFEVSRQRGEIETTYIEFSIISVGTEYFGLTQDGNAGDRWLQFVWFLVTLAMPIVSALWLCSVLVVPAIASRRRQEQVYFGAEIAFCWSCAEVVVLSTLFTIFQIPEFGTGLVESGCNVCYVFDSRLLMNAFIPLTIGALLHVVLSIWVFRKVHQALYDSPGEEVQGKNCCESSRTALETEV